MSKRSLPTETLQQIFSSNLEQHQLAILCRVSKRFNSIVKPFLYRSITLQSIRQANKFKESREEDVKLVEEVRIVGKGDLWEISKTQDLAQAFGAMSEVEKAEHEAGVVKRLLEGEIVNPSRLKRLFLHQIVEDPNQTWAKDFEVNTQIFSSLTELSLVSLRGGWEVLWQLVDPLFIPRLERLALCGVEWCKKEDFDGSWVMTSDLGLVKLELPSEFRIIERFLQRLPPPQVGNLKLVVSRSFVPFNRSRSLLHLAILDGTSPPYHFDKHLVVHFSNPPASYGEIDNVFAQLQGIATNFSSYSLKYLTLPSSLENHISTDDRSLLNELSNLGVALHFDGDLGSGIAPPSFFTFRKKEEEEEAKKALETLDK
ncbi:hypothetical protein JCM3765_004616 [Sporobolomyces pararoseus]